MPNIIFEKDKTKPIARIIIPNLTQAIIISKNKDFSEVVRGFLSDSASSVFRDASRFTIENDGIQVIVNGDTAKAFLLLNNARYLSDAAYREALGMLQLIRNDIVEDKHEKRVSPR